AAGGKWRHRLAGAGLPDNAHRLAFGDADIDVLNRAHDPASGRELDGKIGDLEDGESARHPRGSGPPPRIDDVAQAVAQEIEAEYRDHQRGAGKEGDPPFAGDHERRAFRHHDPPFRGRWPHAESYERETGGI